MAAKITAVEADKINRMNPDAQAVGLGDKMKDLQDYAPVIIAYDVAADSTGNPAAFTAPFAMRIVDIIVQAKATSSTATITPTKGGSAAMCTAIACATDGVVAHMAAGTTTPANLVLAAGDVVNVDASASDVRGLVTFIGIRV